MRVRFIHTLLMRSLSVIAVVALLVASYGFIPQRVLAQETCNPEMSVDDCNALLGQFENWTLEDPMVPCTPAVSGMLPEGIPAVYKTLFEQAAAKARINPQFLAAIFVTEHGNSWPNPNGPWASSPVGASGPFQFMPATWAAYGQGGNVQDLTDSANAAARYLAALGTNLSTELGTLEKPYVRKPPSFLYIAGSYNAGPGNMQMLTTPTSGVDGDLSKMNGAGYRGLYYETRNYVKNVYYLVTSDFKNGNPGYGNATGAVVDRTGGATTVPVGSIDGTTTTVDPCSSIGVYSGDVVKTGIGLAWPEKGHGKEKDDATPAYQSTMPKYHTNLVNDVWSDCGVFVSTVIRSSGADQQYTLRGTSSQIAYMKSNPEKYRLVGSFSNADTSLLMPGDILINDRHTMLYVGKGFSGDFNAVDASWHDHVPQAQYAYKGFMVFRLK